MDKKPPTAFARSLYAQYIGDDFFTWNIGTPPHSNFEVIEVKGNYDVLIRPGLEYEVVMLWRNVDGQINVPTRSSGRALTIGPGSHAGKIVIGISLPHVSEIAASGASRIDAKGIQQPGLRVALKGGTGLVLEGSAPDFECELNGSCEIDARRLNVTNASIRAGGSSRLRLAKVDRFYAQLKEAAQVELAEKPPSCQASTGGISRITYG